MYVDIGELFVAWATSLTSEEKAEASGCTDSLVREARAEGSTEPMNGPLDADFERGNNG